MSRVTGERLIVNKYPRHIVQEHLARYRYASQYVLDKNVLDIACGSGYGTRLMRDAGARQVWGVDISGEAMRYAMAHHLCAGVMYCQGDCMDIPFPDKHFDVVVSFETLEHVDRSDKLVAEAARVLKDDGTFIVSTPNKAISSPGREVPYNPFHVREFHLHELISLLQQYFLEARIVGQRIRKGKIGLAGRILDSIPLRLKYLLPVGLQTKLSAGLRKPIDESDIEIGSPVSDTDPFFIGLCSVPRCVESPSRAVNQAYPDPSAAPEA